MGPLCLIILKHTKYVRQLGFSILFDTTRAALELFPGSYCLHWRYHGQCSDSQRRDTAEPRTFSEGSGGFSPKLCNSYLLTSNQLPTAIFSICFPNICRAFHDSTHKLKRRFSGNFMIVNGTKKMTAGTWTDNFKNFLEKSNKNALDENLYTKFGTNPHVSNDEHWGIILYYFL